MSEHPIVIVGAGPAGLTAALELQAAGLRNITVIEADRQVGGISRTVQHHGNRIDIGGHRFFSKSDWVMDWWRGLMPVATPADPEAGRELRYQGASSGVPSGARIAEPHLAIFLHPRRQAAPCGNGVGFDASQPRDAVCAEVEQHALVAEVGVAPDDATPSAYGIDCASGAGGFANATEPHDENGRRYLPAPHDY